MKDYEFTLAASHRPEQRLTWSVYRKVVSSFMYNPIDSLDVSMQVLRVLLKPKCINETFFIGTHHKVLTTYFRRIFLVYSMATRRRISYGRKNEIDISADVIFDHHSELNPLRLGNIIGLHVRRDPRDLIVSCAHYHVVAKEPWLDVPRHEFGGLSYREKISSYSSLQDRMLFEIDHVAGYNIMNMIDWDYGVSGITELKYEDFVQTGERSSASQIKRIRGLSSVEQKLLSGLATAFSSTGPFRHGEHIRDVRAGQWRNVFTDNVARRLFAVFPTALETLGYEEQVHLKPQ